MSITITDRRTVPEAERLPGKLAFKTGEADSGQLIALDDAEGIVTAIVSVTGTEDEVADIIEPGAYRETLTKRRPKVCWAHSWEHPIGRVLHIEELMPGDPRLPTKTKDGNPWPREAGAVVATMQFNMRTDEGKNAFEAVRFYSETGECEYSIGYQVPPGKSTRDRDGVRHIKALELYELSVVLFGAHTMTGTLSIKDAIAAAHERKHLGGSAHVAPGTTGAVDGFQLSEDGIDWEALEGKADDGSSYTTLAGDTGTEHAAAREEDDPETGENNTPDFSDGVMVAVYPDPAAADAVAKHISGPDNTIPRGDLHVTLAYLGTTDEVQLSADAIANAVRDAAEGTEPLEGSIGGIGQFPADENADGEGGAPTWAPVDVPGLGLLREAIVSALGDAVRTDHGFTPHMTLGYGIGLIDPVPATPVTFSSVRVMYGTQRQDIDLGGTDGSEGKSVESKRKMSAAQRRGKPTLPGTTDRFPIGDKTDLQAAISSYGRANDDDKPRVKRWIIRRARELGATNLLPDEWGVKAIDPLDPGNTYGTSDEDMVYARYGAEEDAEEDAADQGDDEGAEDVATCPWCGKPVIYLGEDDWIAGDGTLAHDNGTSHGEFLDAPRGAEGKAVTPGGRAGDDSPVGTPGGRQNWVDKTGGLPKYMRMVAHALMRHGHSESRAISIAVATMKRWAAGAGHVSPKVQAAAAEALAQWERMKGQSHVTKAAAYDPALDRPSTDHKLAPAAAGGSKSFPQMPGSYEERIEEVSEAVSEALRGEQQDNGAYEFYVSVRATWPDRVIVTRYPINDPGGESESFEIDYTLSLDGSVELEEPEPVDLQIVVVGDTDDEEDEADQGADEDTESSSPTIADTLPLADYINRVVLGMKDSLHSSPEGKAGRVLSGANERQLRQAVQNLLAVLEAAGVVIDGLGERSTQEPTSGDARDPMDPNIDLGTTSPSATLSSKGAEETVALDRSQFDDELAKLLDGIG